MLDSLAAHLMVGLMALAVAALLILPIVLERLDLIVDALEALP